MVVIVIGVIIVLLLMNTNSENQSEVNRINIIRRIEDLRYLDILLDYLDVFRTSPEEVTKRLDALSDYPHIELIIDEKSINFKFYDNFFDKNTRFGHDGILYKEIDKVCIVSSTQKQRKSKLYILTNDLYSIRCYGIPLKHPDTIEEMINALTSEGISIIDCSQRPNLDKVEDEFLLKCMTTEFRL